LFGLVAVNQAKTRPALAGNSSIAAPGKKAIYPEKITPGFYLSEVSKPDGLSRKAGQVAYFIKLKPEHKKARTPA